VRTRRVDDPDRGAGPRNGADAPGAALVTAALMLLVYAIVGASDSGWSSLRTVGVGALALSLLGAFAVRQSRARRPLLPLRVLRSRNVSGANLAQGLAIAGMFGVFFLGALYMQRVLGYSALEVGLAFLPTSTIMGVLSLGLTARLITRYGAHALLVPGLLACALALLLLARAPEHGGYLVDLLPSMGLMGLGAGMSFPALMILAMSEASPDDAGLTSGLLNTTVQVGAALGLSVLATLSTSRTQALVAHGSNLTSALTAGFRLGYVVATALVASAVIVAVIVLRAPAAVPVAPAVDLAVEADAA
jgi:predicted MFS family arabinose efflux permease